VLLDCLDKRPLLKVSFALNAIGFQVLLISCKVMAPFTPIFSEGLYQNLRRVCTGSEESIHYCSFPQVEGEVFLISVVGSSFCLID
jgi:isoleucyl-tRNA synthetase